jgi:hypothetical protein
VDETTTEDPTEETANFTSSLAAVRIVVDEHTAPSHSLHWMGTLSDEAPIAILALAARKAELTVHIVGSKNFESPTKTSAVKMGEYVAASSLGLRGTVEPPTRSGGRRR